MDQVVSLEVAQGHARDVVRVSTGLCLGIIILSELFISWNFNQLLRSSEMVVALSGGQLDSAQAERMIELSEQFAWLGYLAVAPSVLVRLLIAALVLQLAMLFLESEALSFGVVFRAAALAHLARIAESIAGLVVVMVVDGPRQAELILAGNPLSLAAFQDQDGPLFALKMLTMHVSAANIVWIVIAGTVIAHATGRSRRSLLVTCALAWATMLAVRFAMAETLATLA